MEGITKENHEKLLGTFIHRWKEYGGVWRESRKTAMKSNIHG